MSPRVLSFDHVDSMLGPRGTRFFGDGYRRVEHQITNCCFTFDQHLNHQLDVLCTIEYPENWSKKDGRQELRPHLSTIDAFVVGCQLSEALLVNTFGLDPASRGTAWLRKVTMKAGAAPQEKLREFGASSRMTDTRVYPRGQGLHVTSFESKIGNIMLNCEIVHKLAFPVPSQRMETYAEISQILGDAKDRYYGSIYRLSQVEITKVQLDLDRQTVGAIIQSDLTGSLRSRRFGLESYYRPHTSMIDCIVSFAQLAQGLLYELDGFDRNHSNTLWMREIRMETDIPLRPKNPFPVRTWVSQTKILPIHGIKWRTIEMLAEFQGIDSRYSLAHQLPSEEDLPGGFAVEQSNRHAAVV